MGGQVWVETGAARDTEIPPGAIALSRAADELTGSFQL
jgi:hypothetical protein